MKKKQIKNLSLKKFTVSKLNNPHLVMGGMLDDSRGSCSLRTQGTNKSKCCKDIN